MVKTPIPNNYGKNIDLKNRQRKTEGELDKIIARLEKQDSELIELRKLIREALKQNS